MAAFVHTQQTFVGLGGLFKTSPRHALKTSSTHLQRNNFTSSEDEKLLYWRRLQDALNICLEDLLMTYLEDVRKTCVEDVLKTCLGDVLKTLWRQTKTYWGQLYLTNLNVYLTNLYFTNLYLTILRRIQMH